VPFAPSAAARRHSSRCHRVLSLPRRAATIVAAVCRRVLLPLPQLPSPVCPLCPTQSAVAPRIAVSKLFVGYVIFLYYLLYLFTPCVLHLAGCFTARCALVSWVHHGLVGPLVLYSAAGIPLGEYSLRKGENLFVCFGLHCDVVPVAKKLLIGDEYPNSFLRHIYYM
jgi:hypothetical protein